MATSSCSGSHEGPRRSRATASSPRTSPASSQRPKTAELLDDGWDDFAHFFGGIWLRAAAELDGSTREPVFPGLFGTDFWSWLAEHPDERAAFDRAMEQGKERRVERFAPVEWRGDETVVDVGGVNCTGDRDDGSDARS